MRGQKKERKPVPPKNRRGNINLIVDYMTGARIGGASSGKIRPVDKGLIETRAVTSMFAFSDCTYKAKPDQATKGPFCADDCTAVFV